LRTGKSSTLALRATRSEAGSHRAIDIREGDEIDEATFRDLIPTAVAANATAAAGRAAKKI